MIIKHAEAQGLLKQAQDTIKQLVADNDALRAQCDQLLLEKRASGLAHVMADRGLLGQYTIEKMASGLAARPDQLDVVEKALQFNLSDAFAAVPHSAETRNGGESSASMEALVNAIITGE